MPVVLAALLAAAAVAAQVSAPSSTATAAAVDSTAMVSASSAAVASAAPPAKAAPKAQPVRRIHAVIHKAAAEWEPLSVRPDAAAGASGNSVSVKVVKVRGRMKGETSKAGATARLHKAPKDSLWLVIALRPKALERRRTHFEVRFRIFEGYVEEVQAAVVTLSKLRRPPPAEFLDSYELRAKGIAYQEERSGSGQLLVSALDPRPGAASLNSGRLDKAEFADERLGFVNLSWSAKGVR